MQSISSGLAKESERSPILVGEGEGMRVGSQGETLMQQKREHERKAGTKGIRVDPAIAHESMIMDDAEKERQFQQHYKAVIDNISLDADTFTHPVSAYQLLAAQGNGEAEKTLNLVHTSESLQRDKAAINLMSSTAGEPSEEFGVNSNDDDSILFDGSMNLGGDEGPSSILDLPKWALTKESTPGQFNVSLVKQIMSIQKAIKNTSNAGTKAILQAHLDSLHLMKLQQLRQNLSVDELKKDKADLKTYNSEKLDSIMPYGTMHDLLLRLRRESDAEKKLAKLEDRVQVIENSVATILQNQQSQTSLLMQLAKAQGFTPQLDDNKKGEKGPSEGEKLQIQINKVIVPSITVSKPPVADDDDMEDYGFEYSDEEQEEQDVDIENQYYNSKGWSSEGHACAELGDLNFSGSEVKTLVETVLRLGTGSSDLIQAAAANLKVVEKEQLSLVNWKKIDEEIQKKFELVKEPVKSAIHHSQVKQISVNEMSMNYLERGQSSCIKSPKAEMILKPRANYSKSSLKNPLDTVYETPKSDEKKLLSRSIVFYKDPTDSVSKRRIAKIFRNGKEICVVDGHPQFAQAKREEKARLKQEKKQAALDAKKAK
ncbi:hypothetical protein AgCh_021408 [Apium graveolens]